MRDKGIIQSRVPPGAHAQNGRVERVHLAILDVVRTVLLESGLPHGYWAEAAGYAAYMLNHTPKGPKHKIPLDLWLRKDSNIAQTDFAHLQPFGAKCYYRVHSDNNNKLSPRYMEGRLVNYLPDTHLYRVLNSNGRTITTTRDVVFAHMNELRTKYETEEETFNSVVPVNSEQDSTDVHSVHDEEEDVQIAQNAQNAQNAQGVYQDVQPLPEPVQVGAVPDRYRDRDPPPHLPRRSARLASAQPAQRAQPVQPAQIARYEDVSDSESVDPLELQDGDDGAALTAHAMVTQASTVQPTPATYKQARQSGEWEHWKRAMSDELAKMDKYSV
jgi:hypothetical protein